MFISNNWKKIVLSVFTLALALGLSMGVFGVENEDCCLYDEKPVCPSRYSSFNPSEDTYSPGETVHLTLSGLAGEHRIEEIKIEKLIGKGEGVVYSEVINQDISSDQNEWSWSWNQVGNNGELVPTGRYFALVETYCCGIFRTNFKVLYQPKPRCPCNCCGNWSTRLDTGCSRYEVREEVMVNYSNCQGCETVFERIYIERGGCCGDSEIVYSQEFEDGFSPGRNWSWGWDQRNSYGDFVEPGNYSVNIETECCGTLETSFTVYQSRDRCTSCCNRTSRCRSSRSVCSSRSSCCGSGLLFFGFLGSCNSSCSRSRSCSYNTCNTCRN
jgi:hypothetical protein